MKRKSVSQNLKRRNKTSWISKLVKKKKKLNVKDKKRLRKLKKKGKLLKTKLQKLQRNLL
jgi:hypothetical protein